MEEKQTDILMPSEAAQLLKVSRATLERLRDEEGLPCIPLLIRAGKRRTLRYSRKEIMDWVAGRRERQIEATLYGERYTRKGPA